MFSFPISLSRLLWLCSLLLSTAAQAFNVHVEQELDFGRLALSANDQVSSLQLRHRGRPPSSASGRWLIIAHGEPARVRLRELPPLTNLSLQFRQLDPLSLHGQGLGERLQLDGFSTEALRSNLQGEVELVFGGQLRSSGSGALPGEGAYEGAVEVELSYWSPELADFVRNVFQVPAQAELAQSIAASQEAALDFGLLVALPAADGEAALRLAANGGVSISVTGSARLHAAGGAAPGQIRIHGAAPLQVLKLRFEPASIVLRPLAGSSGDPGFIVDDFVTAPQGLAFKTDAEGNLLFSVGARLRTEQGSQPYVDGDYEGRVTLEIEY